MASLTIELPSQSSQTKFNLERWAEVVMDPSLAKIEGRIETDRFGHILMSPPPAAKHGFYQTEIVHLLRELMTTGLACTECPISTADGVRAADAAWASPESVKKLGDKVCFSVAPEICVEIISPGNTPQEIKEKVALYFDAGAKEVWLCSSKGEMQFFSNPGQEMQSSTLCPGFPKIVKLPA